MMNSRPIFPDLSEWFPHDQQLQFIYGTSHSNNRPDLHNAVPTQVSSDQPGELHMHSLSQEPVVSVPRDTASLNDAELTATPMGPPPKSRKKKAPTLRAKDWEPYKARILELHDEQNLPLPRVKTMIEEEFEFIAELRQYRTRISQWGKDKNVKPQEMSAIIRKRQQRKLVEVDKREQTFTVRGRDVEPHKIDRWMARNDIAQTSLYAPSPAASTPSAVGCQTISERGSVASSPANSVANLDFSPRDITSIVSSPAAPSPMSSVGEIAYPHNTTFTGQSPAPVHRSLVTHPWTSDSAISNTVSDEQPPRRYRQDIEDRIRKGLSVAEDSLGINHSQTIRLRIDLVLVLVSQGRYKSAEETVRRAMEDCRQHESNNSIMLDAQYYLAYILFKQGSIHQAQKLAESMLKSRKAILGEEHPSTLQSMETLSCQYLKSGKLRDAEDLCAQAIKISKKIFGERHTHTLERMATLSFIYLDQGQLSDAEKLSLQVLQMTTESFGKMHESTIKIMSDVAYIYRSQDRLKDAEELQVQIVETTILLFGEEHPDTLECRLRLAATYWGQGQLKKADDLAERVLVARKKLYGEQHPETLESMDLMVNIYMDQQRFKEAEDLGAQVLLAKKRVLGEQHPETLYTAGLMEEIYEAQGELARAEGSKEQEPVLEMDWRAS